MTPPRLLLQGLAGLINRALALDPEASARLAPMAGRVLAVDLIGLELPLWIRLGEGGVELTHDEPERPADVTVRATPAALLALAARRGEGSVAHVEFRGDVTVVQQLRGLIGTLQIDWEEQLSKLTGDVVAHQIGNVARGVGDWLGHARRTFERNLGEYLTEEARQIPPEAEVSAFMRDVDRLRQDADRLEARLALLERRRR
jgi:ubiquinone biosynthesis protein UbiJ